VIFTAAHATQIDGEPKLQEPGSILIFRHQSGTMIRAPSKKMEISASDPTPLSPKMESSRALTVSAGSPMHLSTADDPADVAALNSTLIAFINSRSGGGQGKQVLQKLMKYIPSDHIFDLAEGGPRPGLLIHYNESDLKILCCGGDGTCCWVLSVLDAMKWPTPYPPIAVLPLGTGNDLSRALGWGPGYQGESIAAILKTIPSSVAVSLDRWKVTYTPGGVVGSVDLPLETDPEVAAPKVSSMTMNNYWSIGVDAKVALDFHRKREENPHLFVSRAVNKTWYGYYGMKEMVGQEPINRSVTLYLDGERYVLPDSILGVIVLNIQSYAGGCDLWGKPKKPRWESHKPSMSDGLFEVVGIKGTFHMAKIQTGGAKAKHIATV
jgi:diacylglycerol kinase (ATP)